MDDKGFDVWARYLSRSGARRSILGALAIPGLLAALTRLASGVAAGDGDEVDAERRKGGKHRKKRCPKGRRCSKKRCCNKGQVCSGGTCVTGQGTCPAGTNFCLDGATTCNGQPDCFCTEPKAGGTRCAFTINAKHECAECVDDAGCVAKFGGAAFCILGGPVCGCQPGEGICATACPS